MVHGASASLAGPPTPPVSSGQETSESDTLAEDAFPTASVGDTVAREDSVGFEPYVHAVAAFLADDQTEPPLTLSVEGEWGSGKTSFMTQLDKALKSRGINSVWFNAWRHDKDEYLWASFALTFQHSLATQEHFVKRWLKFGRLVCLRFKWTEGWIDLFIFILKITFYISLLLFLLVSLYCGSLALQPTSSALSDVIGKNGPDRLRNWLLGSGGVTGIAILALFLLKELKALVGNPFAIDLKKYVEAPDYASRVTFIERMRKDVERIAKVYAGNRKLCVFIDDLDRCDSHKAAELMQALNLMIPESSNLIFVMGMDRERVAAAIAVKDEKILPYLARNMVQADDAKGRIDHSDGLKYGYGYLEKFIQIPFRVPQIDQNGVNRLLGELQKRKQKTKESGPENKRSRLDLFMSLFGKRGETPVQSASTSQARMTQIEQLRQQLQEQESRITLMVAKALDYNPRRLKQFMNSFRLKSYIAAMTGILNPSNASPADGKLTLDLIGRFVAISLRWPDFLVDLDEDRDLLGDLQELAICEKSNFDLSADLSNKIGDWNKKPPPAIDSEEWRVLDKIRGRTPLGRWSRVKPLMDLLCSGGSANMGTPNRWGFGAVVVEKLLRVSPYRNRPAMVSGTSDSLGPPSS